MQGLMEERSINEIISEYDERLHADDRAKLLALNGEVKCEEGVDHAQVQQAIQQMLYGLDEAQRDVVQRCLTQLEGASFAGYHFSLSSSEALEGTADCCAVVQFSGCEGMDGFGFGFGGDCGGDGGGEVALCI